MAAVGWGGGVKVIEGSRMQDMQLTCGSPEGNCHCSPRQVIRDGRWTMAGQKRKGGKDGTNRTLKRCSKGEKIVILVLHIRGLNFIYFHLSKVQSKDK